MCRSLCLQWLHRDLGDSRTPGSCALFLYRCRIKLSLCEGSASSSGYAQSRGGYQKDCFLYAHDTLHDAHRAGIAIERPQAAGNVMKKRRAEKIRDRLCLRRAQDFQLNEHMGFKWLSCKDNRKLAAKDAPL
jgi:hypothetical protein